MSTKSGTRGGGKSFTRRVKAALEDSDYTVVIGIIMTATLVAKL